MENRNICTHLPEFYEAAATACTCNKEYNKAFEVLNRGLSLLGGAVEKIYQKFAHKMEEIVTDEKNKEKEDRKHVQRKAFTQLNKEKLNAGFRVASKQRHQSFFPQRMNTTPLKFNSIFIAPDTPSEIIQRDDLNNKGEEPQRKRLRLIQSNIPEIRKGRAENIPTSERWSRVKIPQIPMSYDDSSRIEKSIDIFKDDIKEHRNDDNEITAYSNSLLFSKNGEEQQFEEVRAEKYPQFNNIQEKVGEDTLENVSKIPISPEIGDTPNTLKSSSEIYIKTDFLERINKCPRFQIKANENELSLEIISDFILKQESFTGNAKLATLYFLGEMLSCLITLQENEIVHGSISIDSFVYTTSFKNNSLCERNKTLSRSFWGDRGLKIRGFGAQSVDAKSLSGKTCWGAWPSHLRTLQESENWLWDIDIAGVYSALCALMKGSTQTLCPQNNNGNKRGLDVLSELWELKQRGDCCIEELKKLREKVEHVLFGDKRKAVATKAALVWIEFDLFF